MSLYSTLLPIIRSVFSRWTALKLAVAHSMGGSDSEAKYEAFIEALGQHLIRNVRPSLTISSMEEDIQEYLDEILDEEFNTVLDDGSSHELAQLFIRYIQLIHQGKLADVQQELQLQNATAPAVQMSVRNKNEDNLSSSSDDDDDDGGDNEMREEQSSTESKSQAMDVDEEGWTTVHRRGGGKK
jgi:pre-rRNA-processing protein TSR2